MSVNIRRLIMYAIGSGDLSHNVLHETGADRIGALAFADALGAALLRLRWANDHLVWDKALGLLSKAVERPKEAESMRRKVCSLALYEWLDDNCPKCVGRGHTVVEGTPHAKSGCSVCESTGKRRHSDNARMRVLGIDKRAYPKWEPKIAAAHSRLSESESNACREVAIQLERATGISGFRKKVLDYMRRSAHTAKVGQETYPAGVATRVAA